MAITLNLDAGQERRLRDLAEARDLSAEGYLLTLVEAVLSPKPPPKQGVLAAIGRLRNPPAVASEPQAVAEDAIRQMRADLQAHKERVIEAVARLNLLGKRMEQQQSVIAQRELQALTFARDGFSEQALRCFQESCIYGEHLKQTRSEFDDAAKVAEELMSVFKQEEAKMQKRASQSKASASPALQTEFTTAALTEDQMLLRIMLCASSEQWQELFGVWLESKIGRPLAARQEGT